MYINIINESERSRILNLYDVNSYESYGVVEWLSPDEKYAIFLDELYDIENKVKLGNIFENFDNFKFFLKHSFEVATNITEEVKKDFFDTYNSLVITESNQDMRGLKPFIKQLLKEYTVNPFSGEFYSGKNWREIGQKTVDVGKRTIQGVKDIGSNIAKGDLSAAMSIVGKGALWVARKIRSALYNPVGMVLDAILIATGIGKAAQFVVWAIVVALDVYEMMTGNYEEKDFSMGWRLLFLGVDIIGMVTAASAAKVGKTLVTGAISKFGKTDAALKTAINKSPRLKSFGETILRASSSAESFVKRAASTLQKNSPMIYKFISGVLSAIGKFVAMLVNTLKGILGIAGKVLNAPGKAVEKIAGKVGANTSGKAVKGTAAAANVLVPYAGVHQYAQYKQGKVEDEIATSMGSSEVQSEYDPNQI